jgi:hypothetical protein
VAVPALGWSFVHEFVTGDAKHMSGVFTPDVDLTDLCYVAMMTIVIQGLLVLPVLEQQI